MTTTKKWGERILVFSLIALAMILVGPTMSQANTRVGQDEVLVSAATDSHPTEVFSVVHKVSSLPAAFAAVNIDYYPEDKISYFPDPTLGIGTVVTVQRAMPVTLIDGKKKTYLRTWQTTVGSVLAEKKVELGADDKIAPTLATPLSANMTVTITRVARTTVTETETILFQTKIEKDYSQFVGPQTVVTPGKNGQLAKTYLVIREDGELVSKTLQSAKTTLAAVTAVVKQGGLNPVPKQCLPMKDWVVDASKKNGIDPNALYYRMQKESRCNPNSVGRGPKGQVYEGMFQYESGGLWESMSTKAGFKGASVWDARSQIYVTAWVWANGGRGRWPNP